VALVFTSSAVPVQAAGLPSNAPLWVWQVEVPVSRYSPLPIVQRQMVRKRS
jgi:hypothetical protein